MPQCLYLLPIFLVLAGGWLLIRLRAFFVLHPFRSAKKLCRRLRENRGAFHALMLALAGTLGVGNIVGVSLAISVGGAGSVLWLLVASLFASAVKYAEATLAAEGEDGMAGILRRSYRRFGGALSVFYAVGTVAVSFTMGSALQAGSVGKAASLVGLGNPLPIAFLFTALIFLGIIGGTRRIEKLTALAVPFATFVYMGMCLVVIGSRLSAIPVVVSAVLHDAFRPSAALGGVLGVLTSRAAVEGFVSGILSNEAGAGTSAYAHSRTDAPPAFEGLCGIAEIFFDTPVLCMLTALTLLLTGHVSGGDGLSPVALALAEKFGGAAPVSLFLCLFVFAYATVLCWYFYGKTGFRNLTRGRGSALYCTLFLVCVFVGCLTNLSSLVTVSDLALFGMTLLSLPTVIKNSGRVVALSEEAGMFTR